MTDSRLRPLPPRVGPCLRLLSRRRKAARGTPETRIKGAEDAATRARQATERPPCVILCHGTPHQSRPHIILCHGTPRQSRPHITLCHDPVQETSSCNDGEEAPLSGPFRVQRSKTRPSLYLPSISSPVCLRVYARFRLASVRVSFGLC
jgi:hypothetical protein